MRHKGRVSAGVERTGGPKRTTDSPKRIVAKETVMTCPECGWPGVGNMPAGVRQVNRNGKATLIGQLTYFSAADEGPLCSVCRDMKWAVAERSWFVEAHREYMDQVKAKRKLLGEPSDQR